MKNNILPQECIEVMDMFSKLLVIGLVDDGRRSVVYIDDVDTADLMKTIKIFGATSMRKKILKCNE
ncbi:MAG TPA: hypothetical protein ENJ08_00770 [Gammaproteobacteria bacterium]|nr:hypothetical protein [Gammaproteobacteria bacterium]